MRDPLDEIKSIFKRHKKKLKEKYGIKEIIDIFGSRSALELMVRKSIF